MKKHNTIFLKVFFIILSLNSFGKTFQENKKSKSKTPFYLGLHLGLSHQMTDLERTLENDYIQLGLSPFNYQISAGYKLWRFRFETSFIHRLPYTFEVSYELGNDSRKTIDYEAPISSYAFEFKFIYDVLSFKTYVNPFVVLGLGFAHTDLGSWKETEKEMNKPEEAISREVLGKGINSTVILGGLGNSFPINESFTLDLSVQLTFLQGMETIDKTTSKLPKGIEWDGDKALPLDGFLVIYDLLFGLRYQI